MGKIQHTIVQPTGLCSVALLAKSRVNASLALLSLLYEGVLLAIRLCLALGMAVVYTADIGSIFVTKIVPVRFAG